MALMVDKKALWRKVILAKYGTKTKLWRYGANDLKEMSTVWRGIVENSLDERVSRWVGDKDFYWKLGNGKTVLFLEDQWCGDGPLNLDFPRLFRLAKFKSSSVLCYSSNNGFSNTNWENLFVRPLLDREKVLLVHLIERVNFLFRDFGRGFFDWWDAGWKRVVNFEEFYSLVFKVKIHGSCRNLWLIAIAASCWSIWLARNEMVFDKKIVTMDALIFHSKMRAFLWARAAVEECRFQERLWWFCLNKCNFSASGLRGWSFPPKGVLKFNVCGIASDGARGGGGVMRDEDGIVRAVFSRPSNAFDAKTAELEAIITALDVFIKSVWKGSGSLTIEMGSRVIYNWILEKTRRPWSHKVYFAELGMMIASVGEISFSIAKANGNEMAESLALPGLSRLSIFKAWWEGYDRDEPIKERQWQNLVMSSQGPKFVFTKRIWP
ncbi:hypothetical protein J1N35_024036 [Gossypium stocksii]|uniref:RNase H type-1 domain-containing protein n=1 Tax=Gossypium stocksii TaxID=47602 RepID=A0A9D3VJ38_9ROSI|nr:hypothetical protein J1N35_024036 [Gossypium stocksii]